MKDLREYIEKVRESGELRVIKGASCHLEIGAISYLAAESDKPPALLFDNINGYEPGFRVFTIPCSTDTRAALMLGLPLQAKGLELVKKLKEKFAEPLKLLPPVEVSKGPITENVHIGDEADLFEFPTPKWQAGDGGRYIGTGDAVIMKDPDEGWINVGAHRVQIHDKKTGTIFFEPGKHGDIIRKKYWEKGQSCPVAVTCGSDPFVVFIAGTRIPWGMPEFDYMGWWQKKPVEVIRGPITGLPIPAHAEIALEGEMLPLEVESREEGPFSEWPGTYSPKKPESAFKIRSILHRNEPILLGQLPYLGPGVVQGPTYLIRAAKLWEHLDKLVPGVKGVWQFVHFGGPTRCLVISIEQKYGGHAKQVAVAALGYDSYNVKFVIVVDDDVDPSNLREVLWAVGNRADPETFDVVRNSWAGKLDPLISPEKRSAGDFTTSVMVIIACKPYHWIDSFPPSVIPDPKLREEVKQKWGPALV
ncbi:MAG: UbiD family decarboxylase [Chloroflexi bacterium]|nr:UbiD family decarboxylase [Chloroflexota bacterium]